jgi:hypothetical protein
MAERVTCHPLQAVIKLGSIKKAAPAGQAGKLNEIK